MASIVTKYSPGNQSALIRAAYGDSSAMPLQGLGVDWGNVLSSSINRGFDFLGQRFGTPSGTLVQGSDGSVIYRQPTGSNVTLPIGVNTASLNAPEGFSTGIATGTLVMVGAGVLVLVLMMRKR